MALLAARRVAPFEAVWPRITVYEGMKERGSWAPAAWRKAATAEKRNVGRNVKERETWVFRLSGPSEVETAANRLRGTAQAMGNPATRLKRA